jgi:hypothetical protein
MLDHTTIIPEPLSSSFARLLQQDSSEDDDEDFNSPFLRFSVWYFIFFLCFVMATLTEVHRRCHGQESEEVRHAYLNRMAANGIEALGASIPDEEADELRREEKMRKIETVTQKTTMVSSSSYEGKGRSIPTNFDELWYGITNSMFCFTGGESNRFSVKT